MKDERELILIPKIEDYIKYVLNIIIKLPRTEKFSIGTEYKNNIYKMLEEILYINKFFFFNTTFFFVNFFSKVQFSNRPFAVTLSLQSYRTRANARQLQLWYAVQIKTLQNVASQPQSTGEQTESDFKFF